MYNPAEDSFFFAEFLENYFSNLKNKNISYLDMGTGSGILSETAKKSGIKNITASDIDEKAVKFVKNKNFDAIHSYLFKKIKQKFDLITFNTPYLPENKFDKKQDISGGKEGDEITLEFLKQAKKHLNKNGKIFILISSHTPQSKISKFDPKIKARKKLFFEELLILEID